MENKNKLNHSEISTNLSYVFAPLKRAEYLTGFAGYGLIIDGITSGNTTEWITGLAISAISGAYGAYKDINSSKNPTNNSDLEKKLI